MVRLHGLEKAILAKINLHSGEIVWRQRGFSSSGMVYADGKFIILNDKGKLMIGTPGSQELAIDAESQLLEEPTWTAPTVVGTKVFARLALMVSRRMRAANAELFVLEQR